MPKAKVNCGHCGNETSRPQNYKGLLLCPGCAATAARKDKK